MIKKLRYKFIAVTMSGISLIFLLILLVINIFMTMSSRAQGFELLDRVANSPSSVPAVPDKPLPQEKREPFDIHHDDNYMDFLRVFSIDYDQYGNIISVNFNEDSGLSDETVNELGKKVLELYDSPEKDRGLVSSRYLYQVKKDSDGTNIYFLDYTMEHSMIYRLFKLCLIAGIIGIFVLAILVWFLSGWMIEPVERAFEKQKQFIADASHELKTPLTIITTNAEILTGKLENDKWLLNILEQTKRMNHLVRDFLDLARLDNAQKQQDMEQFDLSHAVCGCALSFESIAFESHKSYQMDISDHLLYTGNEQEIKQLVTILLDNAFKYCDPEGIVSIKLTGKGEHRILSVYNTGKGISSEDQKHIFERFYRSDNSRSRETGGYGLGLAIAASITEKHKGQIKVKSDEESYTQITVIL